MDKAQFEREKQCGAAFAIASRLLKSGLITQEEYHMLTEVILKNYRPAEQRMSIHKGISGNLVGQSKSFRRFGFLTFLRLAV